MLVTSIFCFIPSSTLQYYPPDLYFRVTSSSSIDGETICKWKLLTEIYISNSLIKSLPSRFLVNCHNLKRLNLSNNKIQEIAYDAFSGLSHLSTLSLSGNQITTLPMDVFKTLINLEVLMLDRNRIEVIDSQLFFHNTQLFLLHISDNNLRTIEPKSFRTLESLNSLSISNNPNLSDTDLFHDNRYRGSIEMTDCGFTKLFIPKDVSVIYAGGNKISEITAHPNNILDTLFIDRNNFTNLSQLSPLVNLKYLGIEYNGIDQFDHLSHMKNLKGLFMDLNPKQNISAAELKKILPLLEQVYIFSPDLSAEKQKQIFNDFKHYGLIIKINPNEFPWRKPKSET